jgi:ABC-type sugar transport system ATPase subunit
MIFFLTSSKELPLIEADAAEGFGIVMISSEMPEILGMSDTILVMHEGRVNQIFNREEANQEILMEAAVNVDRSFRKKGSMLG